MYKPQFLHWLGIYLILGLTTFGLLYISMQHTEDQLIFPLDDAYIHLAIAEKVFETSNLGISPYQFQNSTSSPGYTLLLALGGQIAPLSPWLPLLVNALFAALWLWVVVSLFVPSSYASGAKFLVSFWLAMLVPIPLLVLNGMEHMAHLLTVTVFLREASRKLEDIAHPNGLLMLVTPLICALRYESLFLVGTFFLLAIYHRRWRNGLFVLLLGAMPLILVGVISLSQGGTFLPLSIIGKAHLPAGQTGILAWLMQAVQQYYEHPFMLMLVLLLLVALWLHQDRNSPYRFWSLMVLGATLAHVQFAEVGGYRYEAYLVGAGLIGVLLTPSHLSFLKPATPLNRVNLWGIVVVASLTFVLRAGYFMAEYPTFSQNVYHQHIQIAHFVERYFPDAAIGVNDIGAIAYLTDAPLTDFVAIGDQEVWQLLQSQDWNAAGFRKLAAKRQLDLAIVHPDWANQAFPEEWNLMGELTIPDNRICAHETVLFYAVNPRVGQSLCDALAAFQLQLPAGVKIRLSPICDTISQN